MPSTAKTRLSCRKFSVPRSIQQLQAIREADIKKAIAEKRAGG